MKKIFYWANDLDETSGEGILARNFLILLKKKFRKYKFKKLNDIKKKDSLFYNYLTPFLGILKIWKYHYKGYKVCYINYLPIWNFLIFLFLPKETILGPITGTTTKKNLLYKFFCSIGAFILRNRKTKLLFSHNQLKIYFSNNKKNYFNFLFYQFKIKPVNSIKKFKLVFYFKDNNNKGNHFLIDIIKNISLQHKIAVIGDNFSQFKNKKNIINFGKLNRNQAIKVISSAQFALTSKENHFSFFALDSLSQKINIFYNKDLKMFNDVKTNMYLPLNFNNLENSLRLIKNKLKKKNKRKFFYFKKINFIEYLD